MSPPFAASFVPHLDGVVEQCVEGDLVIEVTSDDRLLHYLLRHRVSNDVQDRLKALGQFLLVFGVQFVVAVVGTWTRMNDI